MSEVEMRPITVSVANIKKYFGPTRALDGCSFSAVAGEIHAIIGGNGCGKSTLAKVISGVLPVDSGSVAILGEAPSTPSESRALGIATVYQEVLVADESTVVDNLFMGVDRLFSAAMPADEKLRRAAAIMEELAGEPVDPLVTAGSLPLALKQWITIGRALLSNPKVLILDESSAALDFDSTQRLFGKMRELRAAGSTILIVTHRIAELISISDRATVLRDGRDVGVLEKDELNEKNLLALMTGETSEDDAALRKAPQPASWQPVLHARHIAIMQGAAQFSFDLCRGEIVGVAGLDGQGQSEFVRCLAGVQPPVSGEIRVLDRQGVFKAVRDLRDAVRERIAYVSGDRKREGIFASLSIFENLVMPLYRERKRGGFLGFINWSTLTTLFQREASRLMIKFGEPGDRITSLSGGNQQKVLIGRGFAMRPDIIILNDPARGIDVGAKAELYRHLRIFAEEGKSVVYMSSELEEFIGFASRVIVFRNGQPFDAFAGEEVEGHRILEAMFGQTDGSGLRHVIPGTPLPATLPTPDIGAHAPENEPNQAIAARIHETPQRPEPPRIPHARTIRIVEFDANGEVLRRSGA